MSAQHIKQGSQLMEDTSKEWIYHEQQTAWHDKQAALEIICLVEQPGYQYICHNALGWSKSIKSS